MGHIAASTMIAIRLRAFEKCKQANAAVEFALVLPILILILTNLFDCSAYVYQTMQVANAAEMGAQAAWKNCDLYQQAATPRCPGLTAAVQSSVSSTSLGIRISGSPSEGYYCVSSSNTLQYMGSVSNKPTSCSGAGMPNLAPGDYIKVLASYQYAPQFPFSVTSGFPTLITSFSMVRLD